MRGHALGNRYDLALDHQNPMIIALEEFLDDDASATLCLPLRFCETEAKLLLIGDTDRDPAAVIAVERLGDQRKAKPRASRTALSTSAHDARGTGMPLREQLL
jgi:hypothetical protein